jgi:hypothetical protein
MIITQAANPHEDAVLVGPPNIGRRDEWTRIGFPVEGLLQPELWFDLDTEFEPFFGNSSDPALTALLVAAMEAGRPLHLEGPVSSRLIWHMNNTVFPVITRQIPFLPPVPVTVRDVRSDVEPKGKAVLTGFSCGVDSLSVIQDHFLHPDVPDEDRVTHLLFSHVGHHGYGHDVHEIANNRYGRVKGGAELLGLPLIRVYSNTPEFYTKQYDGRLNWLATLTLRNSSVPLLLQGGVRRFLAGSSNAWSSVGVFPTSDMTKADPILLPALGTERIELCAVGHEYTRVEKTRQIVELELARRYLDVCIMEGHRNCSRCEKCLRTLLTLELLGELDSFATCFDLEEYHRHREEFVARVWVGSGYAFHEELKDLMEEVDFSQPMKSRALGWMIRSWRLVPEGVRRRVRGVPGPDA